MRVLFVNPVEEGSGETITSLHIAEQLKQRGHTVHFLASPFARQFIEKRFPDQLDLFTDSIDENVSIWQAVLSRFSPDMVIFADYPLMFMPRGSVPLAASEQWVESVAEADVCLATLDHFGFAQREDALHLGPPHLGSSYVEFPAIPPAMHILLPCPMNGPDKSAERRGTPFRYWSLPLGIGPEVQREVRERYLQADDELLIFHIVSNWAWRHALSAKLPFYRFLPQLLELHLKGVSRPVTVVSVNNGELLQSPPGGRVRFVNLGPISKTAFEELLFTADLVVTENKFSISMGKAVCALQPCAVLKNGYRLIELVERAERDVRQILMAMEAESLGAVYPFEVFPNLTPEDVREIGLYRNNSLTQGFEEVEIFGGEATAETVRQLLEDDETRRRLRERQKAYIENLQQLEDISDILERLGPSG